MKVPVSDAVGVAKRAQRRTPAALVAGLVAALVAVLVTGTVVLGLGSGAASAATPPTCPRTTVKQDIKAADAVFRGVVSKVRAIHGSGRHRTRDYRVAVDRVYKGALVTDKVVVTARVRKAGCTPPQLTKGARYIFFATEKGARLMATAATAKAHTQLTGQVVKQLGDGKQPEVKPPATAEFTSVAGATPPRMSRLLAPGAALVIVSLLGLLVAGRLGRRTS